MGQKDGADSPADITGLLKGWAGGDRAALDELAPVVEAELRRVARAYMRRERADHTLQTSALVNEAYVRLIADQERAAGEGVDWQGRAHFYGIAARIMRRILVDHARRRHAAKREALKVPLDEARDHPEERGLDEAELLGLHAALDALERLDPRQARIVELKFFAGLGNDEIAEVVGASPATVKRQWRMARAWLHREMSGEDSPGS